MGLGRICPSGAQEWSVGCAGGGSPCFSCFVGEQGRTQRAGEGQQGFQRAEDTLQWRPGWERHDKPRAATQHRPHGYCTASGEREPPRPRARRLMPTRGLALQSEGSCELHRPRCLLLLEEAAHAACPCPRCLPLPAPPALPARCQGARSHSALAMAAGAGGRVLARDPSLQKQAERSELPPPSLPAAGSSAGGRGSDQELAV